MEEEESERDGGADNSSRACMVVGGRNVASGEPNRMQFKSLTMAGGFDFSVETSPFREQRF